MKSFLSRSVSLFMIMLGLNLWIGFVKNVSAKVEWEVLQDVKLDDKPLDVAVSLDGSTCYILCSKKILCYSFEEKRMTDSIPLRDKFSQLALSGDGKTLFLTSNKSKKFSIIEIFPIIEVGQSPIIGKAEASVSVVAFVDYQCPYCTRVYPILQNLLEKYPDDVNLIIKHFPLSMHRFARKAARAALAGSRQNKYSEVNKILFKNFKSINDKTIKEYAQEVGLDMDAFEKAYHDPSLENIIQQDLQLGKQLHIRGVPAVFINGRLANARSLDALSQLVERELRKENKK